MIKLNDKAIAVEVPEGVTNWWIEGKFFRFATVGGTSDFELPSFEYEELGLAHELNESQCEEVVESWFEKDYKDYLMSEEGASKRYGGEYSMGTAKESFRSLMESHGLDMKVKTYLILTL